MFGDEDVSCIRVNWRERRRLPHCFVDGATAVRLPRVDEHASRTHLSHGFALNGRTHRRPCWPSRSTARHPTAGDPGRVREAGGDEEAGATNAESVGRATAVTHEVEAQLPVAALRVAVDRPRPPEARCPPSRFWSAESGPRSSCTPHACAAARYARRRCSSARVGESLRTLTGRSCRLSSERASEPARRRSASSLRLLGTTTRTGVRRRLIVHSARSFVNPIPHASLALARERLGHVLGVYFGHGRLPSNTRARATRVSGPEA